MLAFPKKLQNLSSDELLNLLEAYYVRNHDGSRYDGDQDQNEIIQFILNWVQPDLSPFQENNFIQAIRQGYRFDLNLAMEESLMDQIFGNKIFVSNSVISDFSKYPMRDVFGDSWDLLQGFISSQDMNGYFQEITGVDPDNFLNLTEKLFYLTRGYGRPNKYISQTDLKLRKFYQNVEPSSLVALMDVMGICPTKQWPELIIEKLTDIDLSSIDKFHLGAVQEISKCMDGSCLTKLNGCDTNKIECLQDLLKSLGILTTVEYDPEHDVYKTNLSQLNEYEKVVPGKKWSYETVKNLGDPFVSGAIQRLSDQEILKIEVPIKLNQNSTQKFRLIDQLTLKPLFNRLRTNLVQSAENFLLTPKYFIIDDQQNFKLFYGRLIDESLDQMSVRKLEESILIHKALIDSQGRAISIVEASEINKTLNSAIISNEISRTRGQILQNERILNHLRSDPDKLTIIKQTFKVAHESKPDQIFKIFKSYPEILNLILWEYTRNGWIPVAMTFKEYFENWAPLYSDIIQNSLKYYIQVLT